MRAEILIFVLTLSLAAAIVARRRPPTNSNSGFLERRFEATDFEDYLQYYVHVPSFKDSDGDGVGDLPGLTSKLDHLVESNVETLRLSVIFPNTMDDYGYDVSDFTSINEIFGTMEDFDNLVIETKRRKLKLILDWIPNHMSTRSNYFKKSLLRDKTYSDYFIWRKGNVLDDGSMAPPNNWLSVHGGSAWTYREERKAYYYHQFGPEQPDLNYYHPGVKEFMNSGIKFWLDKGVHGLSIGSASYLVEHKECLDEPLSGYVKDPELYDYTTKEYTRNQEQSYQLVKDWRKIADGYKPAKQLIIDTHVNVSLAMKYYGYGARYPLNYELITDVEKSWSVSKHLEIIHNWMENKPEDRPPSWVTGFPGQRRLVTLYGPKRARAIAAMCTLLPGVGVFLSGDDLGLEDLSLEHYIQGDEPAAYHNHHQRSHQGHKSHGRRSKHDEDGRRSKHDEDDSHDDDSHDDDSHDDGSDDSDDISVELYVHSSKHGKKKPGRKWNASTIGRELYLWVNSSSGGFSDNPEPWCPVHDRYPVLNLESQKQDSNSFYNYYQSLTTLKKSTYFKKSCLVTKQLHQDVLAFSRETETYGKAYVLINYANEERRVDMSSFTGLPRESTVYYASEGSEIVRGTSISEYKDIHLPGYGTTIMVSKGNNFIDRI